MNASLLQAIVFCFGIILFPALDYIFYTVVVDTGVLVFPLIVIGCWARGKPGISLRLAAAGILRWSMFSDYRYALS